MMLLKLTFARGKLYLSLLTKVKHDQRMMFFSCKLQGVHRFKPPPFLFVCSCFFILCYYYIDYVASKLQMTLKGGD